jgi:tetratricopeptide (TPR) repeat protein
LIDDLQWADEPSTSLVASLLERSTNLPLMVFALGRPELQERFPNLGDDWNRQEIVLDALRPIDCEKIVTEALGDSVDETTRDRIVTRSAGNPFYLEELIRAAATGDLDRVPSSIIASVQLRIGRLDPAARQVLRAASIYGRRFTAPGISALLDEDLSTDDTADWLSILRREELIEPAGDGSFSFRHDLTREAAYQSLTEDDRRTGHHLAGDFLRSAGETDPVVLAEHFAGGGAFDQAVEWFAKAAEEAMSAGPGDANAVTALKTAATYFAKAGEAAARSYANQEATRFYERAVAIFSTLDPEDAANTRLELADVRERLGQRERALKELAETLEWLGDRYPVARAQILLKRSALEVRSDDAGSLKRARREARAARDLASRASRIDLEAEALTRLAASIVFEDSEESSRKALQYAERALSLSSEKTDVAHALWRLGNVFLMKNELDRATGLYEEAVALAEAAGLELLVANCRANLGMVAFRRWDIASAITNTEAALQIYQRVGYVTRITETTLNLGTFYNFADQRETAQRLLNEALTRGRTDWIISTLCREILADICRFDGDEQAACKHLRQAADTCRRVGANEKESLYLGLLAESLWAAGEPESALAALERSTSIGGVTLSYALVAARLGEFGVASDLFESFHETTPDPHRRIVAKLALARLALQRGDSERAAALCEAAAKPLPAEARRYSTAVQTVLSCAAGDVRESLAALKRAAADTGREAYAELITDVGSIVISAEQVSEDSLRLFLALSAQNQDRSLAHRVHYLRSRALERLGNAEAAASERALAIAALEAFTNVVPPEHRELIAAHPWAVDLRTLRVV